MEAHAQKERRSSARSPLFTLVRSDRGTLWAYDIGLGGMFCRGTAAIARGALLRLEFKLPEIDARIVGQGEVITCIAGDDGRYNLGIRFTEVSRAARMAIYRFLDRRRELWEQPAAPATRPFQKLLLGAFSQLRRLEVVQRGLADSGPSRDLLALGRMLAPDRAA